MFTDNHEMFFGSGFMWVFWLVLAIAFVLLVKSVATGAGRTETPMEILKKRLANGEINDQEYELKRKKLEG